MVLSTPINLVHKRKFRTSKKELSVVNLSLHKYNTFQIQTLLKTQNILQTFCAAGNTKTTSIDCLENSHKAVIGQEIGCEGEGVYLSLDNLLAFFTIFDSPS